MDANFKNPLGEVLERLKQGISTKLAEVEREADVANDPAHDYEDTYRHMGDTLNGEAVGLKFSLALVDAELKKLDS